MLRLARLVALAALSGGVAGLASYAFLESLRWATATRAAHGWLLWLLPVAGLAVGSAYTYLGGTARGGTGLAVREARALGHGLPARMAPMIFGCAVAGHLCGASVGREGAAVQMSASLTDTGSRLLRLPDDERRVLLVGALAAGFGSIIGAPLAGLAFAVQLTKRRDARVVLACAVAAVAGHSTVRWLADKPTTYPHLGVAQWTIGLPMKLVILGASLGVVGRLYMWLGDRVGHQLSRLIAWPAVRPVVGAVATIGLAAMVGRDYLGLSLPLLGNALNGAHVVWWASAMKLILTAVALGSGFVGGEVIPLFVVGATFGSTLAGPLHVSTALLAMCGLATLFTASAQIGLTGVVLATELFGWNATIPVMIVAVAARLTVGRTGLYVNRGETVDRLGVAPSPSR
jgi:H+/Cl- antiporter ClcA